jgi:hypothetical protein
MTRAEEVKRTIDQACVEALEQRGLRSAGDGRADLELAPGITGTVSIFADVEILQGPGGFAASVTPVVGVRHEEASRIASRLLGLPPGQHFQPVFPLENLIKDKFAPAEWIAHGEGEIRPVSDRVAEAVVFYGFPFMERLRSAEAIIHELSLPRWRKRGVYILAVLHMLAGREREAREVLMHHSLPVSQDPTSWGPGKDQFTAFLQAFQEYFDVDLHVEDWPTRQPQEKKPITVSFGDPGVLRAALEAVGRPDLAEPAARLDQGALERIGERGLALVRSGETADLATAFGRAAVEMLDGSGRP